MTNQAAEKLDAKGWESGERARGGLFLICEKSCPLFEFVLRRPVHEPSHATDGHQQCRCSQDVTVTTVHNEDEHGAENIRNHYTGEIEKQHGPPIVFLSETQP